MRMPVQTASARMVDSTMKETRRMFNANQCRDLRMKYRTRRAQWRPSFQGTLQHLVNGHEAFQVLEDDHQSRARVLETQAR